jgi:uncharacterized protein (DUF885 family)
MKHLLVLLLLASMLVAPGPSRATTVEDTAKRVTALADRYVAEYRRFYPIAYAFSGMPMEQHDGIDINAPADLAKWRAFQRGLARELAMLPADSLAGRPEWTTWQFLNHALRQDAATEVCRQELWSVSPLGWQAGLPQLADIQPVGTDGDRAQALVRWRGMGAWVDQEIANLREGQRLGYSATLSSVQSTLGQLDALLAGKPAESAYAEIASRAGTASFTQEWSAVLTGTLWPAFERYRNFLRDEYLPKARVSPSIAGHPDGRECYRALVFGYTTIDADPQALFELAKGKVAEEQALALAIGRSLYGDKATDWATLGSLMRNDPRNRFASAGEVQTYTQATVDRAEAAASRMVLSPPKAKVVLKPFPEFQQASAPGGQYIPAADDGSRSATYLFRNVVDDLYRLSLQNVIVHETWPGHHLQVALLAERGPDSLHPLARLLYFSGPGEGWASYSEDFAREIGLYDSDLEYAGGLMASIAPMMVADLGMQLEGWTPEQAAEYLKKSLPMRPESRMPQSVALIASLPGFVHSYPLGGIQWANMRARAEKALGKDFDVRAFHQVMLEDGMLPFSALEAKLDRWIASGGK